MGRTWDGTIPEDLVQLYQSMGLHKRLGFGKRPAILLVDMIYNSMGERPEPVLESIKKYPYSCGEAGWTAAMKTRDLLRLAREKQVPVLYIVTAREPFDKGAWKLKMTTSMAASATAGLHGTEVIDELSPQEGEIIIKKKKASAFFGTTLISYLNQFEIDTLIITGGATSSCVQATAKDASMYNYFTIVVEECTFDRHPFIQAVTLFDLDAKFCDVVSVQTVKGYLRSV